MRAVFTMILASLCIMQSAPVHARVDVTLEFKKHAHVMNREYQLRDVATVYCSDAAIVSMLQDVAIGQSPRPGQLLEVPQFAVTARLERAVPGLSAKLNWVGEPVIRVRGGGVYQDGNQLVAEAQQALRAWLQSYYPATESVDIGVQLIGSPDDLYVPAGTLSYRPRLSSAVRPRPRMSVWVDVDVDGVTFTTVPVWFAVVAHADVMVAAQPLAKHEELSIEQIIVERRDIAGVTAIPFSGELPPGQRLQRKVEAGQIIAIEHLEAVPHVHKDALITVHADHGAVSLAVTARALSDGVLQQQILVESPSSRMSYRARVIGKNEARVE